MGSEFPVPGASRVHITALKVQSPVYWFAGLWGLIIGLLSMETWVLESRSHTLRKSATL